jgi:integrase
MKAKVIRKSFPKIRVLIRAGKSLYQVDARRQGTTGRREHFSTRKAAEERANEIAGDFDRLGQEGVSFPNELRVMALHCAQQIEPYGKTIADATSHFIAHLEAERKRMESRKISDLAEEWRVFKESGVDGVLRPDTRDDVKETTQKLKQLWGERRIAEVDEKTVRDFLDSLKVGPQRKKNLKTRFGTFFLWCVKKEYTTANPCAKIEIKVPGKDPKILSVEACEMIMQKAEEAHTDLVCYAAICLFAGLRPNECQLLKWENVHLEEGQITVLRETSKVSETRNVTIEPNLMEWLLKYGGKRTGFVTNQTNLPPRLKRFRAACGFKTNRKNPDGPRWDEDVLRHCYASYWLAKHKDRPHLAENMGNSLKMIKDHYKRIVPKSEVEKFWGILPGGAKSAEKKLEEDVLASAA